MKATDKLKQQQRGKEYPAFAGNRWYEKKLIACAVLVLLMVLMPLAALGGAPASSGSMSPADSAHEQPLLSEVTEGSMASEGSGTSVDSASSADTVPTGTEPYQTISSKLWTAAAARSLQ